MIFKKPKNLLEGSVKIERAALSETLDEAVEVCPECKKEIEASELFDRIRICPYCRHHFRVNARQRLAIFCDEGSFSETDGDLVSRNAIEFPDYEKKLRHARLSSFEKDAVITGIGEIDGIKSAIFIMEPNFMMGSMGSVVGEKITRLFEHATRESLPVVGYTVSGGARMQEGILSLMQMAKTSGAVKRHSDAGNLYVAVLTDPTTGGVIASFAMEADIILAEPKALIGFAGPRVIEQTIRKKLPEGFQRAEFLLNRGFVDSIVDRARQRGVLSFILRLHTKEVFQHDGV